MADYELSKKNCETVRNLKDNLSLKYMFPVDTMLNNNASMDGQRQLQGETRNI